LLFFALLPGIRVAAAENLRLELTTTVPGQLETFIDSPADVSVLVVKGPIDVRDLDFIAGRLTHLNLLNLSGATIEAYDGKRLSSVQTHFRANELPAMSLAGVMAGSIRLPETLAVIGAGALAGSGIESITIPAGVTEIHSGAFATCDRLSILTVPAGVISVGPAVFRDCKSLTQVFYNSPCVPVNAFAGCKALRSVYLGNSTTDIRAGAFADCTSLETVNYSGTSLHTIADNAFRNTSATTFDFSSAASLDEVGAWAFAGNRCLESLKLPAQVIELGDGAFFGDNSMSEISCISGLTSVGDVALAGTRKIVLGDFAGDEVRHIGRYAFKDMESLVSFHLPAALTVIGDHAFIGCKSLGSMSGPGLTMVPDLGEDVWKGLVPAEIALGVPENLLEAFKIAPQWREFNIRSVFAGVEDIISDREGAGPRSGVMELHGRFDGYLLILASTEPMASVEIFDAMGRRLSVEDTYGAETITVDTSDWTSSFFIISAEAADIQCRATLKIVR